MARRGRKGKGRTLASAAPAPAARAAAAPSGAPPATVANPMPAAPPQPAAAGPQPASEPRAFSNALIALFVLFQIAMPLRYYLGDRGYDERFSWRMFSSLRMQNCKVRVAERLASGDEHDLELTQELQVAWIGMLERYRPQVVERLLRQRCRGELVRAARFTRTCTQTDGSALPPLEVELDCAQGKLTREPRAGADAASSEVTP